MKKYNKNYKVAATIGFVIILASLSFGFYHFIYPYKDISSDRIGRQAYLTSPIFATLFGMAFVFTNSPLVDNKLIKIICGILLALVATLVVLTVFRITNYF